MAPIILRPIARDWDWLHPLVGPVDDDLASALEEEPFTQSRPELGFFE